MFVFVAAPPARATVHKYDADLSGPNESPANSSPGTGHTTVDFDDVANTLHVHVTFSGLSPLTSGGAASGTTASHIHAPTANPGVLTAGVATTTPTFAGFPLGVLSGVYDNTLDLTAASSYNPAFVTLAFPNGGGGSLPTAESVLTGALASGKAYLNIHTTAFPSGEIRGFLLPAVPEPSTVVLLGIGAAGIGFVARRRG